MPNLTGKVALVTGAASGIGAASALAFAAAGARVAACDRDLAGAEATAKLIAESGGEAIAVAVDVTDADQTQAMVDQVLRAFGRLDCAHNNAGIEGVAARLHQYTQEQWARVLAVNLTGVWLCLKYEIAQMLAQGGGAIVNTSSMAGLRGSIRSAAYAASKHGVVGLTRTAALEYADAGIRVNAVCPGPIRTPMLERIAAEHGGEAGAVAAHGGERLGAPEQVAEVVVWLCSDAASHVSGVALPVDGVGASH